MTSFSPNFDIDILISKIQQKLSDNGVTIPKEEIREAIINFENSPSGAKFKDMLNLPNSEKQGPFMGVFNVKVVQDREGAKPRIEFSFNKHLDWQNLDGLKEQKIKQELEVHRYPGKIIVAADLRGVVEESLEVKAKKNVLTIFGLSPYEEYNKKITIKEINLSEAKIKTVLKNGVCEVTITHPSLKSQK